MCMLIFLKSIALWAMSPLIIFEKRAMRIRILKIDRYLPFYRPISKRWRDGYVVQAVQSSVDRVVADMSCMEQLVASQMLLAAATWLRHVKSIATTYRMTARPPPSKPSHYAASLLRSPMVRLISTIASCTSCCTAHKAFRCVLLPFYAHSVRAVFCTELQPADNLPTFAVI
jgi:hypothetical protein